MQRRVLEGLRVSMLYLSQRIDPRNYSLEYPEPLFQDHAVHDKGQDGPIAGHCRKT